MVQFKHGMVAPLIALFVGVVGFPLGYAAYLSVTDYKLTDRGTPALVGADNFVATFGDSATIGGDPFYARMLEYFVQQGAYKTVWEETD